MKNLRHCDLLLIVLGLVLTAAPPLYAQTQVEASVNADTVGINDQFQFIITVSGDDSGEAEAPGLPRLDDFQVVMGPSVGTQFQWINGRSSSSKSFTWTLLPKREGQFTIDSVQVPVGGKTYRTDPIIVRVTSASTRPPATPRRRGLPDPFAEDPFFRSRRPQTEPEADDVIVLAELDRNSAYPGQQVTLSYHLLTRVGVTGLQLQESPPLNGFWVEDIEVESNPSGTIRTLNGREYTDYVVKKQALFPNAPGQLEIPSSTFAVSARTPGDFFSIFGQTKTLYRRTRELTLQVTALPEEGRPADFGNAVGRFQLSSQLDRDEAATGDAVSLQIKLEGAGNLKMIPQIDLPAMPDFTIYSSQNTDNVKALAGDRIGGDKTWDYVIVPKAPGDHVIPPLEFSFYDPDGESYQTVTTSPLPLKVLRGAEGGGAVTDLAGVSKQSLTRVGSDINFIKLNTEDLDSAAAPLYRSPWFFIAAAIPLAFNVGVALYRRERSRQSVQVHLMRSRKARRRALQRLKQAEKASPSEPMRFYDEAAAALSGYLEDRFGLPDIALTGDTLERTLAERAVAPETVRELTDCLQECDFGRFVSASESADKTAALAGRIRGVINTLEQM
jgi:hypothetical protein